MSTHVSKIILDGYKDYINRFDEITRRAKFRFVNQDWHGIQSDSTDRLQIYKDKVLQLADEVKDAMGNQSRDKALWKTIKDRYALQVELRSDFEIAETFFNSVCRKIFTDQVVDPEIMFIYLERKIQDMKSAQAIYRTYAGNMTVSEIVTGVLDACQFSIAYEDRDRDAAHIEVAVEKYIFSKYEPDQQTRVEVLKPLFYRNKAAYIVGRTYIAGKYLPFVLPILHGEKGLYIDTVIVEPNEVSIIFSFTRSYFMVEANVPYDYVNFLKTLMPLKRYSELYNAMGYSKHGKTVLYRSFLNHLSKSSDQFTIAPGIKGMVMSVFTLPSYPVVFKLIKDKFDPPKKVTTAIVKEKYKLVSRHDRVGRMADTHEFEKFVFPKDRFSSELLEELTAVAPSIVHIEEHVVIIDHLYTERRMTPLNIYLEHANQQEAAAAVKDYGKAIKELAAANIFPGDMLLKNFGVTRHDRVVFYDYDEIVFLTECNFRRIPEPRDDYEAMSSDAWFSVDANDIFPEEFRKFLIGDHDIRALFFKYHDDLFDAAYWNGIKKQLQLGELVDVYPYEQSKRFVNQQLA